MNILIARVAGTLPILVPAASLAQNASMMTGDDGMFGGGWIGDPVGTWAAILLVIVAVSLVASVVQRMDK
jgi:hypothetical protein